jgi:hypothetical protein
MNDQYEEYVNFDEEIDAVNQNGDNKLNAENAKTG